MGLDSFAQRAVTFARENETIIEAVVFVLGFAESLILTSFFVPASALFLGIAALHAAGGGEFLPILLAGTAGAFLGDIVTYAIGWRYKHEVRERWPFRTKPQLLSQASAFFERWGIAGIVLGKFLGPMRPIIPLVSGVVAMPWLTFSLSSAAASLLWAVVFLAPAYYGLKWSLS